MRRILLSMFVVGVLISTVASGCCTFTHGICDCQVDDYCTSRSPWLRYHGPAAEPFEPIPAPASALPEVKTKGL